MHHCRVAPRRRAGPSPSGSSTLVGNGLARPPHAYVRQRSPGGRRARCEVPGRRGRRRSLPPLTVRLECRYSPGSGLPLPKSFNETYVPRCIPVRRAVWRHARRTSIPQRRPGGGADDGGGRPDPSCADTRTVQARGVAQRAGRALWARASRIQPTLAEHAGIGRTHPRPGPCRTPGMPGCEAERTCPERERPCALADLGEEVPPVPVGDAPDRRRCRERPTPPGARLRNATGPECVRKMGVEAGIAPRPQRRRREIRFRLLGLGQETGAGRTGIAQGRRPALHGRTLHPPRDRYGGRAASRPVVGRGPGTAPDPNPAVLAGTLLRPDPAFPSRGHRDYSADRTHFAGFARFPALGPARPGLQRTTENPRASRCDSATFGRTRPARHRDEPDAKPGSTGPEGARPGRPCSADRDCGARRRPGTAGRGRRDADPERSTGTPPGSSNAVDPAGGFQACTNSYA